MKKCKFCSMFSCGKNGARVVLHDGYTDGVYNYYNGGGNSYRGWCAVEPSTGLAVVYANTRKECAAKACSMETLLKVEKALQINGDKFRAAFLEAMKKESEV